MNCGLLHDCAGHGYYAAPLAEHVLRHTSHTAQISVIIVWCMILALGFIAGYGK